MAAQNSQSAMTQTQNKLMTDFQETDGVQVVNDDKKLETSVNSLPQNDDPESKIRVLIESQRRSFLEVYAARTFLLVLAETLYKSY